MTVYFCPMIRKSNPQGANDLGGINFLVVVEWIVKSLQIFKPQVDRKKAVRREKGARGESEVAS